MIPYLVLDYFLILMIPFSLKSDDTRFLSIPNNDIKYCYLEYYLLICFISILMGLRGPFTQDHQNYLLLFDEVKSKTIINLFTEASYTEKGYLLLCKIISFFTDNHYVFSFIISVLFVFLIAINGRKMTNEVFLLMVLFVNAGIYFLTFNMFRQGLASAIALCGIRNLTKGNYFKYFFWVLLAITIHTTSAVMLFAFFILIQKINKKNIALLIGGLIVVTLSLDYIVRFVQLFRYSGYDWGMTGTTWRSFILQLFLCIFAWTILYQNHVDTSCLEYRVLINSSLLYCFFSILSLKIYQISRLSYFFSTPVLILTCKSVSTCKGQNYYFMKIIIGVIVGIYMYIWLYDTNYANYYTFLLNGGI